MPGTFRGSDGDWWLNEHACSVNAFPAVTSDSAGGVDVCWIFANLLGQSTCPLLMITSALALFGESLDVLRPRVRLDPLDGEMTRSAPP